jgi:hypothetical protein
MPATPAIRDAKGERAEDPKQRGLHARVRDGITDEIVPACVGTPRGSAARTCRRIGATIAFIPPAFATRTVRYRLVARRRSVERHHQRRRDRTANDRMSATTPMTSQ